MTPSTTEGLLREALRFANEIAGTYIAPFRGLSGSEECEYSCWGCNGRFMSYAPRWQKPTAKTFTHKSDCRYLAFLAALSTPASPVQGLAAPTHPEGKVVAWMRPHDGEIVSDKARSRDIEFGTPSAHEFTVPLYAHPQLPAVMDYDGAVASLAGLMDDGVVIQFENGATYWCEQDPRIPYGASLWEEKGLWPVGDTTYAKLPLRFPRAPDWRSSLRHVVGGKVVVEG